MIRFITYQHGKYSSGIVSFCLNKIIVHHNLHVARERILDNREEGKSLIDKIREMKGFTTGQIFNAKHSYVSQIMLRAHEENVQVIDDKNTKKVNLVASK